MVQTKIIDGKARGDRLVADVAAAATKLKARTGVGPELCAVLVGEDQIRRAKSKSATRALSTPRKRIGPSATASHNLLEAMGCS